MTALHASPAPPFDARPGDHLCLLYRDESEHRGAFTAYVRQGLDRNEKVLYLTAQHSPGEILDGLRESGLEPEPFLDGGQLELRPAREWYLDDEGVFVPDRALRTLREATAAVVSEGYAALRVTGEVVRSALDVPEAERLAEYEHATDRVVSELPCVALCQYAATSVDSRLVAEVLASHESVLDPGGGGVEAPEFGTPAETPTPPPAPEAGPLSRGAAEIRGGRWPADDWFRGLIEHVSDLVVAVDREDDTRRYVSPSSRAILGYAPEEMIGEPAMSLVHRDDVERARRALRRAKDNPGRVESVTLRAQHRDGSWRVLEAVGTCPDPTGKIGDVIVTARDVTERERREEELLESRRRLRALSRHLVEVQETERRRVSRDLHDSAGQVLTALQMKLRSLANPASDEAGTAGGETARSLQDCLGLVREAQQAIRSATADLRPSVLDEEGLVSALKRHVERMDGSAPFRVELDAEDPGDLAPDVKTACFRIAQEAITNAARHAEPRQVTVSLRRSGAFVELSVRDDGRGFRVQPARRRAEEGDSLGLLGMEERALVLGGELTVESEPGTGTTVRARLPVTGKESGV